MTRPLAMAFTAVPVGAPITMPFQRTSPAWIEPKEYNVGPETGRLY